MNRDPPVDPFPPSSPAASSPGFESFSGEQETSRRGVAERIRLLCAVNANAIQSQSNRRAIDGPVLTPISRIEPTSLDSSHLAKALEMSRHDDDEINGNLFDCNLCLKLAKDPILTCCGHLFCWVCFYQVPYVDSVSRECPVCNGEVTDTNITPIYGNENATNSQSSELNSAMRIRVPSRPQARRVENVSPAVYLRNIILESERRLEDFEVYIRRLEADGSESVSVYRRTRSDPTSSI